MKTRMFGIVPMADGELAAMDGGTHGVSGHTVRVLPDGTARWERRLDSMRPTGRAGSGALSLETGEPARIAAWAEEAWRLGDPAKPWPPPAAGGDHPFVPRPPPPWVWAVLVRRGDEVRSVEGSTWTGAPPELEPLLAWLRARVDAASEADPDT